MSILNNPDIERRVGEKLAISSSAPPPTPPQPHASLLGRLRSSLVGEGSSSSAGAEAAAEIAAVAEMEMRDPTLVQVSCL